MIRHVHQLQHRNHPRSTLVPVQGLLLLLVRLLVIAQRGLASRVLPVSRRQPGVPQRGGWVRPMRRRAWGSRPPATSLRRGASLRRRAATVRWLPRRWCCRCRRRATRRRQHRQAHEAVDRRVHRRAVDGGDEARCGRAVAAGQRDGTPSCGDSTCHAIEQPRHHTLHGTRSGAEVEFMEAKEAVSGGMGTVPPTQVQDRESQTALLIARTNSHKTATKQPHTQLTRHRRMSKALAQSLGWHRRCLHRRCAPPCHSTRRHPRRRTTLRHRSSWWLARRAVGGNT